jgi:hypothetical protein
MKIKRNKNFVNFKLYKFLIKYYFHLTKNKKMKYLYKNYIYIIKFINYGTTF